MTSTNNVIMSYCYYNEINPNCKFKGEIVGKEKKAVYKNALFFFFYLSHQKVSVYLRENAE